MDSNMDDGFGTFAMVAGIMFGVFFVITCCVICAACYSRRKRQAMFSSKSSFLIWNSITRIIIYHLHCSSSRSYFSKLRAKQQSTTSSFSAHVSGADKLSPNFSTPATAVKCSANYNQHADAYASASKHIPTPIPTHNRAVCEQLHAF